MFDLNHLPARANIQIFSGVSGVAKRSEYTWHRPVGTSIAYILAIAGGAGGGNGFSAAAGSARGGGGGGASGNISRAIVFLDALPSDLLFLEVGYGGPAATAGGVTVVRHNPASDAHSPNVNSADNFLSCQTGGAGGTGTGAAAGAAGTAPGGGSIVLAGMFPAIIAVSTGIAGAAGGAQTGAVGATAANPSAVIVSGGGGGAGVGTANTDFAGGTNGYPFVYPNGAAPSLVAGGAAGGGAGADGDAYVNKYGIPYNLRGGCGGGSSGAAGTGGKGGCGAYGCGGGGGGGGVTGGAGGAGGGGLVVIIAI